MTRERWRKIEALYHAALEREPGERAAFLTDACQHDRNLRSEVESLLAPRGLEARASRLGNLPSSSLHWSKPLRTNHVIDAGDFSDTLKNQTRPAMNRGKRCCDAGGTVLDFVAAMEGCYLVEAAQKLQAMTCSSGPWNRHRTGRNWLRKEEGSFAFVYGRSGFWPAVALVASLRRTLSDH
jgi:hypothetical protein